MDRKELKNIFFIILLITINLSCSENYKLTGKVNEYNKLNQGLAEVTVQVNSKNNRYFTTTDYNGYFEINNIQEEDYTIEIFKDGYDIISNSSSYNLNMTEDTLINFTAFNKETINIKYIYEIQGSSHRSPIENHDVENVIGVVTSVTAKGFYMQNQKPDNNLSTSEGIYVYTGSKPGVLTGDWVLVNGRVKEYYPGGYNSNNLSLTELTYVSVSKIGSDYSLPVPVLLGKNGRKIPGKIISDDSDGNVEESIFDPEEDGIDFYESLEGMMVKLEKPRVTGFVKYGEIPVICKNRETGASLTPRGGILINKTDMNPERIFIDSDADILNLDPVDAETGDILNGTVIGIVDYSYGNFKIKPTEPLPEIVSSGLQREKTNIRPGKNNLTVAEFNIENFSAVSDQSKVIDIAETIVTGLNSPDIISLIEIQDNNGDTDDSITKSDETFRVLIKAIINAGGPLNYDFRDISPTDDADGGIPGGNIRVGFLFNSDRVHFVDIQGGTADSAVSIINNSGNAELSFSPGRVEPQNCAFLNSRKPLAGKFVFNNKPIFIIANHFKSKGGDDSLFGRIQPPVFYTEETRVEQARLISNFVNEILSIDYNANVIVTGDLNDFHFSNSLKILKGEGNRLYNLVETKLPEIERYNYIYEGNSQTLDHILLSENLHGKCSEFDIVHRNAEYSLNQRHSDHDPLIAKITIENQGKDTTAPSWRYGYPFISKNQDKSTCLNSKINEPGNIYYVALIKDSTAPTPVQIKQGMDAKNNPAEIKSSFYSEAQEEKSEIITGLENKAYDLYFAAEDMEGNIQNYPYKITLEKDDNANTGDMIDLTNWKIELWQNGKLKTTYTLDGNYLKGSYVALVRSVDNIFNWSSLFNPALTEKETGNISLFWKTSPAWQNNGSDDEIKIINPQGIVADYTASPKDNHKTRQSDNSFILSKQTTVAMNAPEIITGHDEPIYIYEVAEKGSDTRLTDYNGNYALIYIKK